MKIERYENEDLDVLFSIINILYSFYVRVGLEIEAAVRRCFTKWMFLKILQNLKKAPVAGFLF